MPGGSAGWATRLIATAKDRRDIKGGQGMAGGPARLVGFEKEGVRFTVAVAGWAEIAANGAQGHVDVSVPGSGLDVDRWNKGVAFAPAGFEDAGLKLLHSTIIGTESVRITVANNSDAPITPGDADWVVIAFRRRDTA